jgi:hypothetical protein
MSNYAKGIKKLIDEQSKQATNEVVKSSFCLGSFIFLLILEKFDCITSVVMIESLETSDEQLKSPLEGLILSKNALERKKNFHLKKTASRVFVSSIYVFS